MRKYYYFSIFIFFCVACNSDEDTNTSLQAYIEQHADKTHLDQLVACAAGGQKDFLVDDDFPVNLFFYPEIGATDIRYYETENIDVDTSDLNNFKMVVKEDVPVFNGFLRRFKVEEKNYEYWTRVSFIANDSLWYSKPVKMSMLNKPTEFAPQLLELDLSDKLHPIFSWTEGIYDDNIIYFQIVSDLNQNAYSGTYTEDFSFQYYDTQNVVFNVTRPGQTQDLQIGEKYVFTLMGVDRENWVNLIIQEEFTIE